MSNHLTNPEEKYKLSPEALEFTEVYLQNFDLASTAETLGISKQEASTYLGKREVKRFIDTVFMEQGYLNRFKLVGLLETIIESKLEEAVESGIYTGKDLLEVIKLLSDIRKDEMKSNREEAGPKVQVNTQNNYGDNLSSLIDKLVKG